MVTRMNSTNNYKITELDKTKVYYVSMPPGFDSREEWINQAKQLKATFEQQGITVIVGSFDLEIKEVEKYDNNQG